MFICCRFCNFAPRPRPRVVAPAPSTHTETQILLEAPHSETLHAHVYSEGNDDAGVKRHVPVSPATARSRRLAVPEGCILQHRVFSRHLRVEQVCLYEVHRDELAGTTRNMVREFNTLLLEPICLGSWFVPSTCQIIISNVHVSPCDGTCCHLHSLPVLGGPARCRRTDCCNKCPQRVAALGNHELNSTTFFHTLAQLSPLEW